MSQYHEIYLTQPPGSTPEVSVHGSSFSADAGVRIVFRGGHEPGVWLDISVTDLDVFRKALDAAWDAAL